MPQARHDTSPASYPTSRTVLRGVDSGNTVRLPDHPSGDPEPSPQDRVLTRELVEAGKLLEIEVLDHLVIGRGRWTSLRQTQGWR